MGEVCVPTSQSIEDYFVAAFEAWINRPGCQVFFDLSDHHLGAASPLFISPSVYLGAGCIKVIFVVDWN